MINRFFLLCVVFIHFSSLFSAEPKKTVCLNMIVKNETKVIKRCLTSVKPLIDYWVIVDTGSTDGTQEMIKEFMKDIPGNLYETPWINFEHNRNDALVKAKGKADYILVIDADEVFSYDKDFKWPVLDKDFYHITTKYGGSEYARAQLVNNHLPWRWVGVVHEALDCPQARTCETLEGIYNIVHTDGARSEDPLKYQKDALMIEAALNKDPTNTRYMFYLAQSWKDAGEYAKALEWYQKRIDMGGWNEEVYWSMLQVAHMQKALEMPEKTFLTSYYQAFHFRNSRPEALYSIANYYRLNGNYAAGYLIAETGVSLPVSKDCLFVEKYIYDYAMELELTICAYWTGRYDVCEKISKQMLAKPNLPDHVRECVERNLAFNRTKQLEIYDPNHQKAA